MRSYRTGLLIGLVVGILIMTTLVISCVMSQRTNNRELRGTMYTYDIDWEVEIPDYDNKEA
jgi:hypothetical protein